MKNNFLNQSGQAFMELTIMLLILAAMILAVIMLSGLEISSNNMLLSARYNALQESKNQSAVVLSRDEELSDWNYTKLDLRKSYINPERPKSWGNSGSWNRVLYKKGNSSYRLEVKGDGTINIPFSYRGFSSINKQEMTLSPAKDAIISEQYSNSNLLQNVTSILKNHERYRDGGWRKLSDFDSSLQNDFSDSTGMNAFNAAGLISATGSTSSAPATINSKHQTGRFSASNAAEIMYKTFHDLFGIRLNDHCLCEFETNKVYLPIH